MKDAKGHGSNARGAAGAVPAPAYEGKPTWHGVTPSGQKVANQYGPIAYASPEAAQAGAAAQVSSGEAHTAGIAAQHGISGPAVGRGPTMTEDMARSVGLDAGNKSMRAGNRTV